MNSHFNPKHDQALTNLICLHRHRNNHWLYAQIKQPNHWRSCHWGNDFVYHLYFYALAKKANGNTEESKELFKFLANYNFAGWENSIVRNLAVQQNKI